MDDAVGHTNFGERQGAEPDGIGYYAHLSIYDYVRPMSLGKRVLDVGCGTGYGADYLKKNGAAEVVALERDQVLVEHLRSNIAGITFHQCDLDRDAFPVASSSCDVIFCSNVLEHVAYVDPVIAEFARVIAPKGMLLVAIPPIVVPGELAANASNIFHVTNLSLQTWRTKLERYFETVIDIDHQFSHPDFNPSKALKKPEDYDLSSFVVKPHAPGGIWYTITAIFECRAPRSVPLDVSHEVPTPLEWKDLRLAADARQKTFVDLSRKYAEVDIYWRKEVIEIQTWLATAVAQGEPAEKIVAQIRERFAGYYL